MLVCLFLNIFRHMKTILSNFSCLFFVCTALLSGQEKKTGPVIQDFGKVWQVPETDYKINPDEEFKVVFDIMTSPDDPSVLNRSIETAARFLNMHVQSGVPIEQLKAAIIVHNKASKDLITNEAYQKRFGTDNPNSKMIEQLLEANVDIIFCGQSSLSRNFPKQELISDVQLALSAMTALIQLQNKGYRLIKF